MIANCSTRICAVKYLSHFQRLWFWIVMKWKLLAFIFLLLYLAFGQTVRGHALFHSPITWAWLAALAIFVVAFHEE